MNKRNKIMKKRWKEQMFPEMTRRNEFVIDKNGDFIFPTIKYIKGNSVDSEGNLAWTFYDTNTSVIADLGKIFENISEGLRAIYEPIVEATTGYVEGHELNVEIAGKPQNEKEHGRLEAEYLDSIEGSMEYIAGLALHKLRKDRGSKKGKMFTKYTNYFHNLDEKFELYSAELGEMEGLVSDVIEGKPTFQHQADSGLDSYRSDIYSSDRLELDGVEI